MPNGNHTTETPQSKLDPSGLPVTQNVTRTELETEVRGLRKDFIVVFGIFASIVTFLSVEVQVFRQAENISQLVGVSAFLLAAILALLAALNFIGLKSDGWKDFWLNPITILAGVFLVVSVLAFWCGAAPARDRSAWDSSPHQERPWRNEQ